MSFTFRRLVTRKPFNTPSHYNLLLFGVLSLPVIAAIWLVPGFITQDGPLHIYNAHIAAELSKGNAFFQDVYALRINAQGLGTESITRHLKEVGLREAASEVRENICLSGDGSLLLNSLGTKD